MGPRKGLKVTDSERKTRVGIAVESLEDLKKKTIEKFKLNIEEELIIFQTRDGFVVKSEEDFEKLKAQTLLIWIKKGEKADTDAEILYKTIREVNLDFLTTGERVQEFFTEQMKSKVYKLAEVLKGIDDDKAKFNLKTEDEDWFKGVDSRSKTKEEYMFRRSQDRIRTYYYKTKDDLLKNPDLPQQKLNDLLLKLRGQLKNFHFFGCYFDRRFHLPGDTFLKSLCDSQGNFTCQGRWDHENCLHQSHTINPYRSREDRIVFQTWNLDHRIERSRAIIPAVCAALQQTTNENGTKRFIIDLDQIFNDLFTTNNLKLVHIVCHDKGTHENVNFKRYIKYV